MKLIHTRVFESFVATFLAALCGVGIGYQLGHAVAASLAGTWIDQYALRVRDLADAKATEGGGALQAMVSSRSPACSDAEVDSLRRLVLHAEYLKDAGRIHDGIIACSASQGRAPSAERYTPDFQQPDGSIAYKNLAPVQAGKPLMVGVQAGNAYVVFGSQMPLPSGPVPLQLTVSVAGARNAGAVRIMGDYPSVESSVLLTEGRRQIGTTLYATRCSMQFADCVTAYAPVAAALWAERSKTLGGAVSGGLLGALFGLALSLAYGHSLGLAQQLRRAVRKDQLQVLYQPVVDLGSGRIIGAEALVRWNDDGGLAISPDVFIKIAEERGFVSEITRLVLRHALRDFKEIFRTEAMFRVNINIAAADLADPTFIPALESALDRAGVVSRSLGIEITERSTASYQVAKDSIQRLRQSGHIVYIDDFGSGYSSLSYLHDLAVDAIKVDKAFTQTIGTGSVTVNILPQILSMAAALHLQVVVEGVETAQQADYLAGVAEHVLAQGWLFGKPVAARDLQRLLAERRLVESGAPSRSLVLQ